MNRLPVSVVILAACASALAADPFAEVTPLAPGTPPPRPASTWRDNLLFRREIDLVLTGGEEDYPETHDLYSRLSAGFEVQKRFATATRTVASVNYQGRLVYRNHVLDSAADPMGMDADRWEYETHNAYADFYNLPGAPGRFNLRAGRAYLPFGLNVQTDTHATLLQLSNGRLFGTERDWQLTAYGNATEDLDYLFGYVLGSGPDEQLDGQGGMAMGRIGFGNAMLFERGLEGGLSAAWGERLDPHATEDGPVATWRGGADLRKRFDTRLGPVTLTGEAATGEDENRTVWSGLAQADWLQPGRRWGLAGQYFYTEREPHHAGLSDEIDERAHFVVTRYFRNEVGSASLHWLALGVEHQIQTPDGGEDTLLTAQYYRYW